MAVLSDLDIEREMAAGNVIIHPFCKTSLANCSYDVTLGEWFYRNTTKLPLFNPWCEEHVRKYWGDPLQAFFDDHGYEEGEGEKHKVKVDHRYIILQPGETILAHTREFIGGRGTITTMMKARSSLGRSCIAVCKCAGWGDIGYVNRWTMEITNLSTTTPVVLPVGARVAQIVFMYTGETHHQYDGKYQGQCEANPSEVVRLLEEKWTPECMLPKLWLDDDV
jgi:dCTP deaminase